jgi:hypothetical protein
MPDGCLLVAGGADGVALLTPGEGAGAPPRVRHLCGGGASGRDSARSNADDAHAHAGTSARSGAAAAASTACATHGNNGSSSIGGASLSSLPSFPFSGAASWRPEGGALLAAAANQAWVVTGHGDGAMRVWRLEQPPPP